MKRAPETKSRDSLAYAPRFFLSMLLALVAFAVVTYLATGSFATTAIQTLVCAVLIQLGYFATMLYLVRQEAKARKSELDGRQEPDKATPKVPVTMNEPGHSKF
ncbi:MAG TPA: exopolysaccharide production repressor protein [Shinella sp.]|jgi:exopolysaccharide production repressor protein|uniref:exopolysaccharide production repressor protein n=1 Tax=Shinella sp. TaxID=1870904 RepID=UPI0029B61F85|nr:exopolysaccharide production repressor protein [Shinella sp.]MDX3975177.1 exopolysaccharide production repressor protein [Shinella sp.]HEV7249472.1 exopolysaccharide production repressor protein [Shinella sp.]